MASNAKRRTKLEKSPFIKRTTISAIATKTAPDAAIPSTPSIKLYKFIIQTNKNQLTNHDNQTGNQSTVVSTPPSNQNKIHPAKID
jgi:hypothetical protein